MYFILSKVLLFLLYPILWVFVLLVITLLTNNSKRKRRLFIISLVVLYLFSNPLIIAWISTAWSVEPVLAKEKKVYSCAIILGGFSSDDAHGNGYFNSAADRFIQGLKLLSTGRTKHLLITGGNGTLMADKFREASWVKTQLDKFKVPDSSVLIESNSRNTIENAVFSKTVLQKAGLKPPYLLVTSDFHMRRAYMIFQKQGYDVTPFPCNFLGGDAGFSFNGLIPDAGALAEWNTYLKEMVGYIVDYWKK